MLASHTVQTYSRREIYPPTLNIELEVPIGLTPMKMVAYVLEDSIHFKYAQAMQSRTQSKR